MLSPFFALAALSPTRQRTFRRTVIAHLLLLAAMTAASHAATRNNSAAWIGYVLLSAGIVEGALLIGWRLTQLPKSQALEFLLVSPLRPSLFFLAEALVGTSRLALVTLSGLPLLVLLAGNGLIDVLDLLPLIVMPLTWGVVTGLGLTVWAFESAQVRRWGERVTIVSIILYLAIGVLAGEHLKSWVDCLPGKLGPTFLVTFEASHRYNPFGVMGFWMEKELAVAWERTVGLEVAALLLVMVLALRAAWRLKGHFHDRHYRPVIDVSRGNRGRIGVRPLTWWAVRRVTEYSGRINLWLAGGVGVLYAIYTVAGPLWPDWLGKRIFVIFDQAGGIPVLATALVLLGAVPAAFQYGLWDSSARERCRRLELLLLTQLSGRDYWEAAAAAAWRRGRGYFSVALVLWLAACVAGQITLPQFVAAAMAGVLLWGLYFALGFRAFSRGMQANGLGLLLTLGLPLVAYGVNRAGWSGLAQILPPGSVFAAGTGALTPAWLAGPVLTAALALLLSQYALARCDGELRHWYELHHGRKMLD